MKPRGFAFVALALSVIATEGCNGPVAPPHPAALTRTPARVPDYVGIYRPAATPENLRGQARAKRLFLAGGGTEAAWRASVAQGKAATFTIKSDGTWAFKDPAVQSSGTYTANGNTLAISHEGRAGSHRAARFIYDPSHRMLALRALPGGPRPPSWQEQ
jgi:hypothetical protein